MRSFILVTVFLLACAYSRAQSDWVVHTQQQGIVFSVQNAVCNDNGGALEYKFIRVQNSTAQKARIQFRLAIYYVGEGEAQSNSPEYASDIILEPGTQMLGSCSFNLSAKLDILTKNPHLPSLEFSHFDIKDINIGWIE